MILIGFRYPAQVRFRAWLGIFYFAWHLDWGLWLSGLWPIRLVVDEAGVSDGWIKDVADVIVSVMAENVRLAEAA